MHLALLGVQGAGKGTLRDRLAHQLTLTPIGLGDLLRLRARTDDDLGASIRQAQGQGVPAPEPVARKTVAEALCRSGGRFVLDGFPRGVEQATYLDEFLVRVFGRPLDQALVLDLDPDIARRRILHRLVCADCGKVASANTAPKTSCDCGGRYVPREDDTNVKAVEARLRWSLGALDELVDYYKRTSRALTLDARPEANQVAAQAERLLRGAI